MLAYMQFTVSLMCLILHRSQSCDSPIEKPMGMRYNRALVRLLANQLSRIRLVFLRGQRET